jgi:predicted DNA-binding transcriptional regulator AlpA
MAKKIDPDDYLTPMQAATEMGCSMATVYNYIAQGKLKKRVILGSKVLEKEAVMRLKEAMGAA